ncbi:MAG TPA: hypothetical protein VG602_09105 [Actinomycetota bacterium]|nr:hypothetical protein [Actinomycetota bacterium]
MKHFARLLAPAAVVVGLLSPLPASSQAAVTLDVTPETATRGTGLPHVLTATTTANQDVDFAIVDGPGTPTPNLPPPLLQSQKTCKTPEGGTTCTVTFDGINTAGTSKICAWMRDTNPGSAEATCSEAVDDPPNEGDRTDVVTVDWVTAVVDLEPEDSSPAPGTAVTLTVAVLENKADNPKPIKANVDVEVVSGPNAGLKTTGADLECDHDETAGKCTVSYTGKAGATGIDVVRAHLDANDNGKNAPEQGAAGDEVPGEADNTEKKDATKADQAGGKAEPDNTDVVEVNWGGAAAQPPKPGEPGGGKGEFCKKSRENANKKEILVGDEFSNKICGFSGNDALRGLSGNDILLGGGGNDKLKGGDGNDELNGQAGKKDASIGGKGKDDCTAEKEKACEKKKKGKKKKS